MAKIRVLHTSDWHLGKMAGSFTRENETDFFLDFLIDTINRENIDLLLVSGDIFDTALPPIWAQRKYFFMMSEISSRTDVKHIVVTSGNHDSPSFLDASSHILEKWRVKVITDPGSVILTFDDVRCTVVAVPHLRDGALKPFMEKDEIESRETEIANAQRRYFASLDDKIRDRGLDAGPVILMAHLYACGARVVDDERINVGTLYQIRPDEMMGSADYTALGHIHMKQRVSGNSHVMYCGTPYAMSFSESGQKKYVIKVTFDGKNIESIDEMEVPQLVDMVAISGDMKTIEEKLSAIDKESYVMVTYRGDEVITDLADRVDEICSHNDDIHLISLVNETNWKMGNINDVHDVDWDELDEEDVFSMKLEGQDLDEDMKDSLWKAFREICSKEDEI